MTLHVMPKHALESKKSQLDTSDSKIWQFRRNMPDIWQQEINVLKWHRFEIFRAYVD